MAEPRQLGAVEEEVLKEQRERQQHPEQYRPKSFGLVDCDRLLDGYDPSWYVCIGGKAKSGKTTFVLHAAITLATQGVKILYVPLEERAKQLAKRALSRQSTKVRRSDFRNLRITDEGFEELHSYAYQHKQLPFKILEGQMKAQALFQYRSKVKPENRPHILVIDHLQLFQDRATSMAEKADLISAIMMQVRNDLNVGVLCAFQLGDKGKRQYGGTSVYRDADAILHLEQKKDAASGLDMEKILQVTVMPSREIEEGMFEVTFSGAHSRVSDVRPRIPPELLGDAVIINDVEEERDEFDMELVVADP